MIYRSFNLTVIIRLLIFAIATAGLGIALFQLNWLVAAPLIIVVLVSFFTLVYFLNGVNRKVAFFSMRSRTMIQPFITPNRTERFQCALYTKVLTG